MIAKPLKVALAASALIALSTTTIVAQTNTPTLKLVTPSEGQTLFSNRVPVLLAVENFQVVDYMVYSKFQRGQGHIHLWLDAQNPTKESASKVTAENFTYTDVPYGDHTLKAELVNNDHSSLTPPLTTTVKFKSTAAATPAPAAASGFDKNTALVILVVVALVIVAAWWYTKDEEETPMKASTTKKTAPKKKGRRTNRRS